MRQTMLNVKTAKKNWWDKIVFHFWDYWCVSKKSYYTFEYAKLNDYYEKTY